MVRILGSGAPIQLTNIGPIAASDITDTLTITITNLAPNSPRADFDKPEYRPSKTSNYHPFDFDYRGHPKHQVGKFLKVIIRIDTAKVPDTEFTPSFDEDGSGVIKQHALTGANPLAGRMLFNLDDNDPYEITFHVKQLDIPPTTPKVVASFNLGFRFADKGTGQKYDGIYDPQVPNDGS